MTLLAWVLDNCKFAKQRQFSPQFLQWFGQSKVVDANGQPLAVYKSMYPYNYKIEPKKQPGDFGSAYKDRPGQFPPPEHEIRVPNSHPNSTFPSFNKDPEGKDEPGIQLAGFFGSIDTSNDFSKLFGKPATYAAYLSLQNPYIVDTQGGPAGKAQFGESGRPFRDAMRSGDYDGAIIKNTKDEGTIYVAKFPEQIKSAISPDFS